MDNKQSYLIYIPKGNQLMGYWFLSTLAHLVLSRAWWGNMLRWYWAATAFNMSVAVRATSEASMHLTRFRSVKNHFMDPAELQFTSRGRHSTWAWSSWKLNDGARSRSSDSLAYLCRKKKRTSRIRCALFEVCIITEHHSSLSLWGFPPPFPAVSVPACLPTHMPPPPPPPPNPFPPLYL